MGQMVEFGYFSSVFNYGKLQFIVAISFKTNM